MHQNTCVRSIVKSHFYDLIVIGNDFSGLVTATLCAKRGLRVLIVQQECTTDPITPFPHGCDLTEQTIRELMIGHFLRDNLSTDVCSYQFISENTRINIYPDNNKLIRELSYVLENDEIHHLMNQIKQSTQSTQSINEMFQENNPWPKQGLFSNYEPDIDVTPFLLSEISPWSTMFFSAPLYAETNICPSQASPLLYNYMFNRWQRTNRYWSHKDSIVKVLSDVFIRHSGVIHCCDSITTITSRNKATGVLIDGKENVNSLYIVMALSADKLSSVITVKKKILPVALNHRITLEVCFKTEGISKEIASCVLYDSKQFTHPVTLLIKKTDSHTMVFIRTQLQSVSETHVQETKEHLLDILEDVMPFSKNYIVNIKEPSLSPLWEKHSQSTSGISVMPYHLGLNQLVLSSSDVFAGLGFEGAILSGRYAADIICKTKPFAGHIRNTLV